MYDKHREIFAEWGGFVYDCKTAVSFYQRKIGRNVSDSVCNETDKELIITLNLGSKQSGKSMPQSMFNDQDPISRENDLKTVGDRCPCTCKKGT